MENLRGKMKRKFKTLIGMILLAGNLSAETNSLSFIDPNNIKIDSTKQIRTYSLQSKNNLLDPDWIEETNQRGTESNLVFNIDTTEPTKFYRTVSSYEPISPARTALGFSSGQQAGIRHYSYTIEAINYAQTNIDVTVDWENSISVGVVYRNTPFNQTLTPGTNDVTYLTDLDSSSGTVFTSGYVTIK